MPVDVLRITAELNREALDQLLADARQWVGEIDEITQMCHVIHGSFEPDEKAIELIYAVSDDKIRTHYVTLRSLQDEVVKSRRVTWERAEVLLDDLVAARVAEIREEEANLQLHRARREKIHSDLKSEMTKAQEETRSRASQRWRPNKSVKRILTGWTIFCVSLAMIIGVCSAVAGSGGGQLGPLSKLQLVVLADIVLLAGPLLPLVGLCLYMVGQEISRPEKWQIALRVAHETEATYQRHWKQKSEELDKEQLAIQTSINDRRQLLSQTEDLLFLYFRWRQRWDGLDFR